MTAPFGPGLEAALKENVQGGRLHLYKRFVVNPRFFCCISGTSVGVAKDPVALLVVNPQRVCTNTAVNANYSRSWSPSSIIASWSISWGDGTPNSGAAVWPDVGNVNHPMGGYALPGIYNITLTVTDLLGARGVDRIQVEVLDCTGMPEVEAFCGCGSSGIWYTNTGGRQWVNRGGGVLDDVVVYDLSASPYTFGTLLHKVWAATEDGLYLTEDSGLAWYEIELPDDMSPRNVCASPYSEDEIYVLCQHTVGAAYLLWSEDNGETWTDLALTQVYADYLIHTGTDAQFRYGNKLDSPNAVVPSTFLRQAAGIWSRIAGATFVPLLSVSGPTVEGVAGAGIWGGGTAWTTYDDITTGYMFVAGNSAWSVNEAVLVSSSQVWYLSAVAGWHHTAASPYTIPASGEVLCAYVPNAVVGYVLIATEHSIIRWDQAAGTFTVEWSDPSVTLHAPIVITGVAIDAFISTGTGQLLVRNGAAQTWALDTIVCPEPIISVTDGHTVASGDVHVTTETGIYQRDTASGNYLFIIEMQDTQRVQLSAGGILVMRNGNTYPGIYRIGSGTYTLPASPYHHLMNINASGEFIYIALTEALTGNPAVMRVSYNLELMDVIYEPGAGTRGGVAASPSDIGGLWLFGDFGAAAKVRYSDDAGESSEDITDAGWAANEVVRAVLPSLFDVRDAIAVLNVAQETYVTRDATEWVKTGDIEPGFVAACATRDPLEPFNLFIGREDDTGPPQLQYSPNEGVGWLERSAGIGDGSIITVIEVVG